MPDEAAGRDSASQPSVAGESSKMRAPFRRPGVRSLVAPLCVGLAFLAAASWFNSIDWNGAGCARTRPPLHETPAALDAAKAGSGHAIDLRKLSDDAFVRAHGEAPYASACRRPVASRADIDTLDVFPRLDFQVRQH